MPEDIESELSAAMGVDLPFAEKHGLAADASTTDCFMDQDVEDIPGARRAAQLGAEPERTDILALVQDAEKQVS